MLASGAILPAAGAYDVVFDSPTVARAGAFSFRFWIGDTKPPTARPADADREARHGARRRERRTPGSGVYPASLHVLVDGQLGRATYSAGRIRIATGTLARGRHALRLQISDYQETRNMENVAADPPEHAHPQHDVHRALSLTSGRAPSSSAGSRGHAGRSRRTPPPRS